MSQALLRTLGVVALLIVCVFLGKPGATPPPAACDPTHRVVTISNSPDPARCEVDFPIALLRRSKKHDIQWMTTENRKFYVSFVKLGNQLPDGQNPLVTNDPIEVAPGNGSGTIQVKDQLTGYYQYSIYFDNPPVPGTQPCLAANFLHDTGLDVQDGQ